MAVGFIRVLPRLIAGNSTGRLPAFHKPRVALSACSRRLLFQRVSPDQVLQIPAIGRPSVTGSGKLPLLFHELRMNRTLSNLPYQVWLRFFWPY